MVKGGGSPPLGASAAEQGPQDVDAAVFEGHVAMLVAGADDDDLRAHRGARVKVLDNLVQHAEEAG